MSQLLRSMVRRWYLVLVVVALTGAAAIAVLRAVPPTYTITSDVVLIPPKSTEDPQANRFLLMSGLGQAVEVLVRSLDSEATHELIKEEIPTATFTVATDVTTSAPILTITGEAPDAAAAESAVDAVLHRVPDDLSRLQDNLDISQAARISSTELSGDLTAKASNKQRVRAAGAVAIVVFGLGMLMISILDGMLLRRRRRKQGASRVLNDVDPSQTGVDPDKDTARPGRREPAAAAQNGGPSAVDPGQAPAAFAADQRRRPHQRRNRPRGDGKTLSVR